MVRFVERELRAQALRRVFIGRVVDRRLKRRALRLAICHAADLKVGLRPCGGLRGGAMVLDQIVTTPFAQAHGAVAANRVGRNGFLSRITGSCLG
jgi:hypothetical protein